MDTFRVVPVLVPRGLCSTACIVSEKSRGLTARCRWFWLEDPMLLFCTRLPRPAATRVRGGERGSEGHDFTKLSFLNSQIEGHSSPLPGLS